MRKTIIYSIFFLLIIVLILSRFAPCLLFKTPSNFQSNNTTFSFKRDGSMQAYLEGDMGFIGTYSCKAAGLAIDVSLRNAQPKYANIILLNPIIGVIFKGGYVGKRY